MKRLLSYIIFVSLIAFVSAQSGTKADIRFNGPISIVRIDGLQQNGWLKVDNEGNTGTPGVQITGTENVNFYSTSDGIFINVFNGTNKIKLFALTGQLLFNGDLNQGHFLVRVTKGIYFLKINNKSFKVICK